MTNILCKRGIVLGIIVLFVGASIVPGISGTTKNLNERNSRQSIVTLDRGGILYVGGTGEGNYTSIQDAINDASDGDTVFAYNGTYYENVIVNKSITLEGENKDTTIIDGEKHGIVVSVHADFVCVRGFSIQNSGWKFYPQRAGVRVIADNTIISDNIIKRNQYGISLGTASHTLISNNTLIMNLWGVDLSSSLNNVVIGNIIRFSISGIKLISSSYNNIINNTVHIFMLNSIYLSDSYNNMIKYNNFYFLNFVNVLCSFRSTVTFGWQVDDGMKELKKMTRTNIWFNNYWNRPKILPKPIYADLEVDALIGNTQKKETIRLWDWFPARQPN